MTRWALGVEYNGAPFFGWQTQIGVPTVQAVLEEALARIAGAPVRVIAAGRTDTGVHAAGQVVHFDSTADRRPEAYVRGTNAGLPPEVAVLWARVVPDDFHARFSAEARRYRYVLMDRRVRPGLLAGRVSFDHRALDASRMHEAAQALIGRHDFSSFRASQCQAKSPVRTIHELTIRRHGPFVVLRVRADGFLHHMVRNVVGVLAAIGAGERPVGWAEEVRQARDRSAGGLTASPQGLYLEAVDYPVRYGLPSLVDGTAWSPFCD